MDNKDKAGQTAGATAGANSTKANDQANKAHDAVKTVDVVNTGDAARGTTTGKDATGTAPVANTQPDPGSVGDGSSAANITAERMQKPVNFADKTNASPAASDAMRDQNFDGTLQAGKDTLNTPKGLAPTDAAAETSQLSANQLTDRKAAGPAVNIAASSQPGEAMVDSNSHFACDIGYYRSSIPTFGFRYARGLRGQFSNYWLKTNDERVRNYIHDQLMEVANTSVIVEMKDEAQFNQERNIYGVVQPTIEPLPPQDAFDARRFRQTALQAKAPRTADNPDMLEPETGNAQQDHFTNYGHEQTDNLHRPIVDDRVQSTEAQRAVRERAAAGGAAPATDAAANHPNPTANKGGFTTGMQGSTGPSSAPRRP